MKKASSKTKVEETLLAPSEAASTAPGSMAPRARGKPLAPNFGFGGYVEKAPVAVGDRIAGRYRVLGALGDGGMGVVVAAVDEQTNETAAIKVMRPKLAARRESVVRFRNEYYLMATLRHPHFVEVRDYVMTDAGLPGIVMEHVAGDDLSRVLPLPWQEAAGVIAQIASALAFLHARRYIHHDLKPVNVRVFREKPGGAFRAKLIDFGIMEPLGASLQVAKAGTVAYVPPEALLGAATDHRLDLYALGVTAFEMLTGRLPFTMLDTAAFLAEKQLDPPNVCEFVPEVPFALGTLIADLMAVELIDRPYDASVVLQRLREVTGAPADESIADVAPLYLHPSRLVGREMSLGALLEAWGESVSGPRLAVVSAEAGFGKSSVLRELRLRVRMQSGVTSDAAGDGLGRAFGALRDLLSPLVHLADADAEIEARLLEQAPVLVRVLPELKERYPAMTPAPNHPDAAETRLQTFNAVRAFLAALLKENRVALLLDDAHLADALSLDGLAALLSDPALAGLFVVATARRAAPPASGATLGPLDETIHRDVALPPLDAAHVRELVDTLFGRVDASPRFVEMLARAGQGNPSFLIEVLRRMVDIGAIERRDERWRLPREIGEIPLPGSLAEAIAQRIGALDEPARHIVEALAVANREVAIGSLSALAAVSESALFGALDRLVAGGSASGRDGVYRLAQGLPRDAVYGQIAEDRRLVIHRRAGEIFERDYGGDAPKHAPELAEHFRLGRVPTKAREYLAIACTELYDAQALADSVLPLQHLEVLLREAGAEGRESLHEDRRLLDQTRARLARVGFAIDLDMAERYFALERAALLPHAARSATGSADVGRMGRMGWLAGIVGREILRSVSSPKLFSGIANRMVGYFVATTYHSVTLVMRGSFAGALEVAAGLEPFALTERANARAGIEVCRSVATVHQGKVVACETALLRALSLLEDPVVMAGVSRFDKDSAMGGCYTAFAQLYAVRGRPEALSWLTKLERFADESKLTFLLPNLFLAKIDYHLHRGEVLLVQEVGERYKVQRARVGRYSTHLESQIDVGLARAALAVRDLARVDVICSELTAQNPGDFFSHGWGACVSGELFRLQRLYDRSRESLSVALRYATREGQRSATLELRALNASADLEFDAKRLEEAQRSALAALMLATSVEHRNEYEELAARRTLARIAAKRQDEPTMRAQFNAAVALAGSVDNPLFTGTVVELEADIERAFGSADSAAILSLSARQLFLALGYVRTTDRGSSRSRSASGSLLASVTGSSSNFGDRAAAPTRPESTPDAQTSIAEDIAEDEEEP